MLSVLDQAIQLEVDGEKFYREIAAQAKDESVKIILGLLADDEVKHRKIFEKMKLDLPTQLVSTHVLGTTIKIFNELRRHKKMGSFLESVTQALGKAEEVEVQSYNFYRAEAATIINPEYQAIVMKIADEEEQHAAIVLDLMNYYLEPKQWLENAEWNHHDEY